MTRAPVVVVGGGIVGLASAWKLLRDEPRRRVVVLEREPALARHQSGRNSGVLHAGLSYTPGSLKARLAVDGLRQMRAFCRAHEVPLERCGKLVVAADQTEVPRLRTLHARGRANGLQGLRWLAPAEARELEPSVGGVAALHVPEEGIVDFAAVCRVLAEEVERAGGRVVLSARVDGLVARGGEWVARTTAGEFRASALLNCAGLWSDQVARMAGARPTVRIVPIRGQYYALRPERRALVRHLVYPVPDPAFPFLGAHLTRRVSGAVDAGPTAALALWRAGVHLSPAGVAEAAATIGYPGLWRFVRRHPAACWSELRLTHSRALLAAALRRLVPAVQPDDLVLAGAGVRAQAMQADGTLVEDFAFLAQPRALHVLNAPSPGATASLAIADEVVRRLREVAA